jgi:transcription elongation factor Elf1
MDRCPFCAHHDVTVLGVSGDMNWVLLCGHCDRQWKVDDGFRLVLW